MMSDDCKVEPGIGSTKKNNFTLYLVSAFCEMDSDVRVIHLEEKREQGLSLFLTLLVLVKYEVCIGQAPDSYI